MRNKSLKRVFAAVTALVLLFTTACGQAADDVAKPEDNCARGDHNWQDGVCSVCGAVCVHDWHNGVCTVCGTVCVPHRWEDGICTVCGCACAHDWHEGVCRVCGMICAHDWQDGVCSICGFGCDHSWDRGVCTSCGYACRHYGHDRETLICPTCGEKVWHSYVNGICSCGAEPAFILDPRDYPVELLAPTEERGKLETFTYPLSGGEITPGFRSGSKDRELVVYTPYGYDPSVRYNVLILMPGAGHTCHAWLELSHILTVRNSRVRGSDILDGLIASGSIEPLIVVSVEYYHLGTPAEISVPFEKTLRELILPFVVENYSTYAEVAEDGSFVPAREHFAIAGASFGAMIIWQLMQRCEDLFAYWGCYSGRFDDEDALIESFALTGSGAYTVGCLQAGDGMRAIGSQVYKRMVEDLGTDVDSLDQGKNLFFHAIDRTEHTFAAWYLCLHNGLQLFFRNSYRHVKPLSPLLTENEPGDD